MTPRVTRVALAAGLVGLAVLYYFGLGPLPTPSEWGHLPWWRPRGFLIHSALTLGLSRLGSAPPTSIGWPALAFFVALPLGLGGLALRTLRGPVPRTLLLALTLTASLLAVFGLRFGAGWRFFSWRFPWVILCTSGAVAAIALAPSLLEWVGQRRVRDRICAGIAVVLGIYLASTEITGWAPTMPANLSLWPVLTVFGLLTIGTRLASLHLAAGLGSGLAKIGPETPARLAGAALAGAVAAGLPWLLSLNPGPRMTGAMGLAGALYGYWAGGRRASGGIVRTLAGAILLAAITLSNAAANRNHAIARNVTSARVIQALASYHEKHDAYPDRLEDMVPEEFAKVPEPRIGWIPNSDDRFSYLNFGDSYALEFPSVRWIQCSYSPPYVDPYADEDEDEGTGSEAAPAPEPTARNDQGPSGNASELGGSWTCASTPPKLF